MMRDSLSRRKTLCITTGRMSAVASWDEAVQRHRDDVREGVLDAAEEALAEAGAARLTMSGLAARAGVGRATLYRHFTDVDAVLAAWHQRLVARHLDRVRAAADRSSTAGERLRAALAEYAACLSPTGAGHAHGAVRGTAGLHGGEHVTAARAAVVDLVAPLVAEAAAGGQVRDDVPPRELAAWCVTALEAVRHVEGGATRRRLLALAQEALAPR